MTKDLTGVHIQWSLDYWDGPLTGIATHNDKWYYFRMTEEFGSRRTRRAALYALTDADVRNERARHSPFQHHIGMNTDYVYDAKGERHQHSQSNYKNPDWNSYYRCMAGVPASREYVRTDTPVGTFLY